MKQKLLFSVSLLLIAAPAITQAADDMPKQAAFARYEAMMNHSLFAVATAVVPPPTAPNFAKDLYIANAARLQDEGIVTLTSSTDKNMKEYLSTKAANPHGYKILNIEWSDRVGQTKVTIEKDGQSATLPFNQALITQPVAGMQPQPPPQTQPQPPPMQPTAQAAPYANANQVKPAPVPMLPTPPPRVRGVIQRNPAMTKDQAAKEQQSVAPSAAQAAVQEPTDQ